MLGFLLQFTAFNGVRIVPLIPTCHSLIGRMPEHFVQNNTTGGALLPCKVIANDASRLVYCRLRVQVGRQTKLLDLRGICSLRNPALATEGPRLESVRCERSILSLGSDSCTGM